MQKVEIIRGLSYLGVALGKEYTEQECEVYYDFLKEYDYEVFINAIKNRIAKSSYLPKINELIEECKLAKKEINLKVVEIMKQEGYFKDTIEYQKTILFINNGVIPFWLQDDINKYFMKLNRAKSNSVEQNNAKPLQIEF